MAALSRVWPVLRRLSAAGIFLMMLVAFVDVLGRKFLGQSLRGTVELTELLMLLVVFMGVALVSQQRSHVQLDLLDGKVPPRWRLPRERAGELVSALVMLGCAWLAGTRTVQGWGEERTTLLQIPLAPAYAVVAALFVLAALAHAAQVLAAPVPEGEAVP